MKVHFKASDGHKAINLKKGTTTAQAKQTMEDLRKAGAKQVYTSYPDGKTFE